ncbi:AraC family transcriptional regulator [Paenibacillus sp. N4]|uniref:AraC family transcriptional regulator n=1 Tax=Paenibacillus vietnamensis TaxID=2590547 RepID=UPI001CD0E05F|nr:AraC family transcriptional regulator [Paenibacillus vietnamensis]MCA0754834.1 AraC family transcriptional regulator [Paenibacillus vietnamensis]
MKLEANAIDTMVFPILTETDTMLPLYLTSNGHWSNQETIDRPDGYPHFQWLQVMSGAGELYVGDQVMTVRAGQGFCLFPDVPHRYHAIQEPWEIHWLSFRGELSETLFRQAGITKSGVYSTADHDMIVSHMKNIYAMTQSGRAFMGLECSKLVYMFLLDLMKVIQVSSHSVEQNYVKLHPVFQYIEANYDRLITIKDLAACIDVTPQYLCLLFKKAMKMRPMEYVNRERINRSKELMFKESGIKMHEIAMRVGFDSPSYFSSVFKRLERLSPEQFKRIHGIR